MGEEEGKGPEKTPTIGDTLSENSKGETDKIGKSIKTVAIRIMSDT